MATELQTFLRTIRHTVPSGEGKRIGIVVSEWNYTVTGSLLNGAIHTLLKFGVREEDIVVELVPGSFELTYGQAVD